MLNIKTHEQRHAKTCPYCREDFLHEVAILSCSNCNALLHIDCWNEHPQCMVCDSEYTTTVQISSAGDIEAVPASAMRSANTLQPVETKNSAFARNAVLVSSVSKKRLEEQRAIIRTDLKFGLLCLILGLGISAISYYFHTRVPAHFGHFSYAGWVTGLLAIFIIFMALLSVGSALIKLVRNRSAK